MIAIVLLGLLAAATAAPHFDHLHSPFHRQSNYDSDYDFHPSFGEDVFDTHRFWQDMESQLQEMDRMIDSFRHHFPTSLSTAGVVGNEYRVTIPLTGYDEKDIVVKAREGMLMVQAVHKQSDNIQSQYIDIRTLPSSVDVTGVWTYEKDVLTIVFPVKASATTEATFDVRSENEEPVTKGLGNREEMGHSDENDAKDADVGVHTNVSKESAIQTNEIEPKVEATTYAVDLKDEVEFVPVNYK